jgi:hypothetical protein
VNQIGAATGPSRWLPWPLDTLARAAWDETAFWARHLSPRTPARVSRQLGASVELIQRPRVERYRAELEDGSSIDYFGNETILRNRLLFAWGARSGVALGRVLRRGLRADARPEGTLRCVEIPSADARAWAAHGHFILPLSVNFEVDLRRPERELWDARKRESIHRIERAGFTAEIAGLEALDEFYDQLYVPTCLVRHGSGAFVRRRHYVRRAVANGRLLFVVRSGRRLAALLLVPRWSRMRTVDALLFGVRTGEYAGSTLAREAAYLFALRWARDDFGADRFGLTGAPPLLNHGLLRFKKRWGAEAVLYKRHPICVALRIESGTPALWSALAKQPPICVTWHEGMPRLCALVPSSNGSPPPRVPVTPGITTITVDPASLDAWRRAGPERRIG